MKISIYVLLLACLAAPLQAQDSHKIPLNRTLVVEVPLEYTFKAGVENIRKTVSVRLEVKDFAVLHNPLKQFIEGGALGMMYDEVNVTRWYHYTSPEGIYVDNEFIPFSDFLEDPGSASFQLQNVTFVWTQGSARYAVFSMGSPYLNMKPKSETPGYAFDIYNLSKIVGTETGKEAFDKVKGKGEIVGAFLQVEGISYRPPYKLEAYLRQRAEKSAQETGSYASGGFKNPVNNDETSTISQKTDQTNTIPQQQDTEVKSQYSTSKDQNASQTTENSSEYQARQQQVKEWQKDFDRSIDQGKIDREKKRAQYDQMAEAGATAAVALMGILDDVIPPGNFGLGTFTYAHSKLGNKYYLQGGAGYRLTPKGSPQNVALAAHLVLGAYQSDANWQIYQRENANDPTELAGFEGLKTSLMIGLGGNLFFDIPAWKRKAINISGSWVYGYLDFSDDAKLSYVPIGDSSNDHFGMVTYKLEFIHFFSDQFGLSLGVGYENNKGIYHDDLGKGEHTIKGFLFCVGLNFM